MQKRRQFRSRKRTELSRASRTPFGRVGRENSRFKMKGRSVGKLRTWRKRGHRLPVRVQYSEGGSCFAVPAGFCAEPKLKLEDPALERSEQGSR